LGFEEIILCGVPLAEGTYSDGSLANDFMRPKILDHYRRAVLATWLRLFSRMPQPPPWRERLATVQQQPILQHSFLRTIWLREQPLPPRSKYA